MNESKDRAQSLFLNALEIPTQGERAEYIDAQCGADPQLRKEVEELLDHARRLGPFLEPGQEGLIDGTIAHSISERPGTIIGPYKLLQQIGEGGMGVVFMAAQNEPIQRTVALKIIKPGMDTRQVITRFEAERQALALMDHPNIAKILDAGSTENGRPYFVMELVKGVPIIQYCDEHRLTPRERLELFIPICQAVQHAHQKGIIHRDLKPTNVLVADFDERPVTKIIDFGVAKAVGQQLTEATVFTQFGQVVGTIEYMSPEQAKLNQLDIDTRTDIYSLGVLLYELLTGETPFDRQRLRSAAFDEMLRIIREEDPPKPSTRLSSSQSLPSIAAQRQLEPKRLTTLVAGELDWIVMKALEKDRSRRYETAIGFAMDVERYLADEPVLACPPSASYRFRKFARRNRGRLAAAAVLGVALLAVAGVTAGSIGWAVRNREARQARLTGQVETILEDVTRPEQVQKWPDAQVALQRAEAVLAVGEAGDAIKQRVSDARRDLAFIAELDRIREERAAEIGGKLGFVGVMPRYAEAFRAYGVDVEALPAEESSALLERNPALAMAISVALDDWVDAWLLLRETEPGWKKLVAVARALDHDPVRDRLRAMWGQPITPELQAELQRLAASIDVNAQRPATLQILARTLDRAHLSARSILQSGQQAHPADYWLNIELGRDTRVDDADGVRYLSAAVALRPDSAWAHFALGSALRGQKKINEAIPEISKAVELEPRWSYARLVLGMYLFHDQGDMDAAMVQFRNSLELEPKSTWACFAHAYLGQILHRQGKKDEAIAEYRKAIELDPKYFRFHDLLGDSLFAKGRVNEAIAEFRRVIELQPKNAVGHYHLGIALKAKGDLDDAIAAFEEAIRRQTDDPAAHFGLASALAEAKQWDRSASVYAAALKRFGAQLWPGPWYEAIGADEVFTRLTAQHPEDRLPWIMRARLYVLHRDWQRAVADYARVNESALASIDPAKLLPEGGDEMFGYGCLLLLLGDRHGYEQFCKKWADRVGDAPAWGYDLARAWGVSVRPVVPAQQIVERAGKTLQASRNPWDLHVMSLAYYRNAEFELAIQRAEESNGESWSGGAKALNWLVLAMAHSRLGHAADARNSLQHALELAGQASPEQLSGVKWPDMAPADLVEFELLRREAEAMIDPKSEEKPDKKPD